MARYMEMMFIDSSNNARLTGVGVEFQSDVDTTKAFEQARCHDVGKDAGTFILDLCEENGDIVDSIAVSADSFSEITGKQVLSEAEYIAYDERYWRDEQASMQLTENS